MSDPWAQYLAAVQRLDAVRRGAATAADEQASAVRAARDELAAVRARLAPQYARLRGAGVPESDLVVTPADLAAAAETVAGGPESVLAALRTARATADRADAVLIGADGPATVGVARSWASGASAGHAGPSTRLRNLLVYGPFAVTVFVVQVALYLASDATWLPALLFGSVLPAVAYGLGWLTVGLVFPAGPAGRVDRTPGFGAIVSAIPLLATCLGAGALRILG